jgi:hypothetical protein|tara:strand:+ start:29 stop:652 length:624 start_codon:yes stop_codon:yes gene_type:complete
MANDNQAFNFMNNVDSEVDYTGVNAEYYLQKYVDRPEDAGNLEGFQNALSDMGIVNPGADAINAAIYAAQGEWGDAALSAVAVIPILGEIKRTQKLLKKSGEKMVTLYRAVEKWYPGQMVKEGNFVGGGKYVEMGDQRALWVTGDLDYAKELFPWGDTPTGSIILEFKVPESLVKSQLTKTGQYNKKVLGFFEQGLSKTFLTKVHTK